MFSSQAMVSLNFNNYYGGGVTWHYLVLLSIIGDDIVSATFLTISYRQVGISPIRFADIIGNHWSSPMPIADLRKLADIVSATALDTKRKILIASFLDSIQEKRHEKAGGKAAAGIGRS